MRLRFFAPTDEQETAAHLALQVRIAAFWKEASETLARSAPHDLEQSLSAALRAVDPRLWVFCNGTPRRDLELTVTPGEDSDADPIAHAVVDAAPALTAATAVRRYRPAASFTEACNAASSEATYDWSLVRVRAGVSRGHLLELVLYSPEFTSAEDERALDSSNQMVARLLGDERFDTWIGSVAVAAGRRPSSLRVLTAQPEENRFALAELESAVAAAVSGIHSELASAPAHLYCERADWVMFELEPEAAEDYRAQDDVALCTTMLPEMLKSYLQGLRFSSARFSKTGEHFCYLKIDANGLDPDERVERRIELEDALNFALVPGKIGCVVGSGVGVRYVYVTLALANLEAGVELAARTARREKVAIRSWILFCDDIWKNEWVGVWDETPPPP